MGKRERLGTMVKIQDIKKRLFMVWSGSSYLKVSANQVKIALALGTHALT